MIWVIVAVGVIVLAVKLYFLFSEPTVHFDDEKESNNYSL